MKFQKFGSYMMKKLLLSVLYFFAFYISLVNTMKFIGLASDNDMSFYDIPQGCEYDLLQNIVIEADGKEFTSVQYDSNRNILPHKTTYSGIACLIAAEKRIEKLLQDRHFIDKDTDIEYNDLFGQLAKKLAKDLYKLYEHRKMILDSLYWFYSVTKVINPEDSLCIKKYAICCKNVAVYYNVAQKFVYTRDWHVLEHLKNIFSAQYKNEHKALNELVLEMKNVWYKSI